jgi:hypothetical protein
VKKKRLWAKVIFRRRTEKGEFCSLVTELLEEDEAFFLTYMRMLPSTFRELLEIVAYVRARTPSKCRGRAEVVVSYGYYSLGTPPPKKLQMKIT